MRKNIIFKLLIVLALCLCFTLGFAAGCGETQFYTVSFVTNGGSTVPSQSVESGKTATKPANPEKDGYVFDGWFSDSDCKTEYDFNKSVTANISVYAKWTEDKYTVTFMSEGEKYETVQVANGKTASAPADPEKDGYEFDGWIKTDGTTFDFSTPVTGNLILYAQFKAKPSSGEGESQNPSKPPVEDNTPDTPPTGGDTPVTPPTGGDTPVTPPTGGDTPVTPPTEDDNPVTPPTEDDNPDVYYTVSFNSNGGSSVFAQSVIKNGTATLPQAPVLANKVFDGWYDITLTNKYSFNTPVTADITLYAKWKDVETVSVYFDSKGGSDVFAQQVGFGAKVAEPKAPTRSGYTFAGWYTDETYNSAYNFDTAVTSGFTLYAKWTAGEPVKTFEVEFDSMGGSLVYTQQVTNGGKALEPIAPTKEGYTFDGWYTDEEFSNAYNFNSAVSSSFTLYAKWTENSNEPKYIWVKEQADFTDSTLAQYTSGNKLGESLTVGSFTYAPNVYFEGASAGLKAEKGNINTQGIVNAITFKVDGSTNAVSFSVRPTGNTDTIHIKSTDGSVDWSFELTQKDIYKFAIGDTDAFDNTEDVNVVQLNLPDGSYYLYGEAGVRLGDLIIYEYMPA